MTENNTQSATVEHLSKPPFYLIAVNTLLSCAYFLSDNLAIEGSVRFALFLIGVFALYKTIMTLMNMSGDVPENPLKSSESNTRLFSYMTVATTAFFIPMSASIITDTPFGTPINESEMVEFNADSQPDSADSQPDVAYGDVAK